MFFPVLVIIFGNYFQTDGETFLKKKEVFVRNNPIPKKLSWVFHMCHGLGYSNESLQPIFPYLKINVFFVLVTNLRLGFQEYGD